MKHMNAVAVIKKNTRNFHKINPRSYWIEEKFQGIRAFITIDFDAGIKIVSRGGHDITRLLPHITSFEFPRELSGITFDGELYDKSMTDNQLAGELNYRRVNGVAPTTVDFHVFDVIKSLHGTYTDSPLITRRNLLEYLYEKFLIPHKSFKLVNKVEFENLSEAKKIYHQTIANGGEGIVFKNIESLYQEGKRPEHTWYKWKKYETIDVVIMGFTSGKGKYEGLIGAIEYGLFVNDHLKYIGNVSGIDDTLRTDITSNPDGYIGRIMELGAHTRTADSFREPRFIRFRDDKTPKECTW